MKINEIALNENVWTNLAPLASRALPRIERLPGETMKDAIKRATSELGGVKSADNLVSPAELSALRRDPVPPSSGPAVWTKRGDSVPSSVSPAGGGRVSPRPTGPGVTVDQLQTPANGIASMNIDSAKRAAQANAAKRAPAPKSAETPAPKPAADDLSKQIKPGADAPGQRQDPSINTPADDLAKQIRPGTDTPKTPGGRAEPSMNQPASGENKLSIDDVERLQKMFKSDPAAAQAAAKEAGIDLSNPGIFRRNPWKTAAAALSLPTVYNKLSPTDWPKAEYTPYSVLGDLGVKAGKNLWKQTDMPKVDFVDPTSNITPSADAPLPSEKQVDTAIKNDPANQEVSQEIEKWNREHPDNPIKESYTNELNRMVFLSRP